VPVPQVVIVGRPNVGKSSLFNWLARKRLAIVDDFSGVTRDRVSTLIEIQERFLELVDTGGMGIEDADNLTKDVHAQIELAIESADLILFVVDAKTGMTPLDEEVAERLRPVPCPVVLVANKTDHPGLDAGTEEFRKLGRGHLVRVSTLQNRGRDELLSLIYQWMPPDTGEAAPDPLMKVAIVGRRNVGKSTFVNTLAQAKRMIVSEVPGTTRDSVDVHFQLDGHQFIAIDTPGLRKTKSVRTDLEFYSTHRAQRSIRRADVVLMFLDSSDKISKVDKQLCGYIADQFKPLIFVINKWDKQVDKIPTERWVHYLHNEFPTMRYAPIAFVTGQTGKNVKALLNHAQMLFKQSHERVTTGQLNRIVKSALESHPPPMLEKHRPKVYYGTQVAAHPPTIVLMCNHPRGFSVDYRRYLLGVLRDYTPFGEVPIKLYLQQRESAAASEASQEE
jgi:GTP-binding protein